MPLNLTIDEGNSATKLALWRDGVMTDVTTHRHASYEIVRDFIPAGVEIDSAIFCSVCGRHEDDVRRCIGRLFRRLIVLDASTPLPLKIEYRTPDTLGADRIAAAVGATVVAPGRNAMIADLGTAITYDVVTDDGRFLGGNIAPGIFLRLEALSEFTKALPMVETDGDVPRIGYDTVTAMRSGAIRGVVGELQYYRHSLISADKNPAVILTGGSADLIIPYITSSFINEPNLVLIGLNRILDYNEAI